MIREDELLKCPFCNGDAYFEREGTSRRSCIVNCSDCGCRLESNETCSSGSQWNKRIAGSWRDIATAPKNGSAIWVAQEDVGYNTGRMLPVFWKNDSWCFIYDNCQPLTFIPTCWQPLPKSPTGEESCQ